MKGRNLLLVALTLGLTTTPTTSRAQSAPPAADFQAGTQEVLVDVAVTDKKGNVPRDLTAQDFKILEDGKDQKITSFSFTGESGPGRTGRHFLALVFEVDQPIFRQEALRFIDKFAGPDLYIAVYARVNREIQLELPFTTNAARIKTALTDMQIVGSNDLFYNDKNLIPHSIVMENVSSVAADLARIHGRKALVLFTNEWYSTDNSFRTLPDGRTVRAAPPNPANHPPYHQILQTIDDCNQANVAVYSFTLSLKPTGNPEDWYHPEDDLEHYKRTDYTRNTDHNRELAEGTGGRYGNPGSNQLAEYIGSIAATQDDYYLLGYTPSAASAANNCHKLKVTVARKGLDIDARDTYCTSGVPDSSLKAPQRALEALAQTGATGTVPMTMQTTWFYLKRGTAIANVAMNIGPAAMQSKGNLHGQIPVLGVAYRADGSVAARFSDTIDLNFETQAELDDFRKTPYPYSNQLKLPPGSYRIRVIAGTAGKTFGTAERQIEIAPWGGETLTVSAIALGDHDNPLSPATIDLDPALLDGPYRLASQAREFIPMGVTQFRLKQQGLLYFEIYEPGPKPPTIDLSIVDRAKGEQKIDSGPMDTTQFVRPGSDRIPITMRFPSADLPAGNYTLELRVTHDDSKEEIVRTTDFEIR